LPEVAEVCLRWLRSALGGYTLTESKVAEVPEVCPRLLRYVCGVLGFFLGVHKLFRYACRGSKVLRSA
jgi:hypothetical protein